MQLYLTSSVVHIQHAKVGTPKCDTCFSLGTWQGHKQVQEELNGTGFVIFGRLYEYPTSFQSEGHKHTYSKH